MRIVVFLYAFFSILEAGVASVNIAPKLENNRYMNIKILDQKQLSYNELQGVKFAELSDVTYHTKTDTLYFVGDKGSLFAFSARFGKKIEHLEPLRASRLKTKKGKKFRKWKRDSEGLTLDGEGRLLISFEGEAKIGWFHKNSQKYGSLIRNYTIPKVLRKKKNYRSKNKSLEALAWHKKYGILTAAEWPLKKDDKKRQTIYALSGKKWHFKAEPEGRSSLVAMEVMDDDNLLVLERSYTGMLEPFVVTLKKVNIKNCRKKMCPTQVLAKMNSHKGWSVDNFEGLAKVGFNRYVMVSDNGDNFFQKTLLIYFEVL
jgi:hypothetical protein